MNIRLRLVAAAIFAGLAIGSASTAWADQVTLSGHYIDTETDSGGQSDKNDWYFTPCGDGCASVAGTPGGQAFGQAQLVNGQWTMAITDNAQCADGTNVPNANSAHYTWDPQTFAGTVGVTTLLASCGNPVGNTFTDTIQLTQAS